MADKGFKRKLAAILSADVEGYSRLMGDDEEATVRTLTAYREVLTTLIQQHNGKVLDSPGDNLLAEFVSVVDAVQCAVAVQKEINARNAELPENRKMQFRIGINLGDVIQEEGRIYGDGVNIAARLEGLAEPGGICISKTAFDHIESKLPYGYDFIGDQTVKNIAKPVGAYRVLLDPRVTVAGKPLDKKSPPIKRIPVLVGAVVVLVLAVAFGIWQFYLRRPSLEPASAEKMTYPLPQKPSVAVLPFVNMSGDPGQEFFSNGLTDQIIASLSRVHELFVIARNSTFTYKGKSVKVQQVAEDLGVRYVLEGSVRKSEDRLRVTVQLIDALKGHHLWAEQYDRQIKDIFAVQDDITMQILRALQVRLTTGPIGIKIKGTQNLQAYLKLLEAISIFFQFSRDGNVRSRQLCEETIVIDPEYATAYGLLSFIHMLDIAYGLSKSRSRSLEKAAWYAKKAQGLDENNYIGYIAMGGVYVYERDYENAIKEAQKAIELAPGAAAPNHSLARALCFSGRSHEAIDYFKRAIRIDPFPSAATYLELGYAYFLTGNYEEAVKVSKKACTLMPDNEDCHRMLAASYGMLGEDVEARAEAAELLRIVPEWSIEGYNQRQGFIWKNQGDLEHFAEGSRRAGLPEKPQLPLPDKPSIAVLPFVNMSDDPKQEYFSDGITDDLITDLSKISGLFVIARNSSFQYKGKAVDIKTVSSELGVRYVLEGSVRRVKNRVRINAQLIDATTGGHMWAETYDELVDNIFALQDRITRRIVETLAVKLTIHEMETIPQKDTNNLEAYLTFLKGWQHYRRFTPEALSKAIPLLERAVELDPNYWRAYAALAKIYLEIYERVSWRKITKLKKVEIYRLADRCLELAMNGTNPLAYAVASKMHLRHAKFEEAITEAEKAVDLDSNDPDAQYALGLALVCSGRHEQSVAPFKRAMRLDPFYQGNFGYGLAIAYFFMLELEKAAALLEQAFNSNPENEKPLWPLIATYGHLGRMQKARTALGKLRNFDPNYAKLQYFKYGAMKFKEPADNSFLADGLRKAGMD